jgi:predicted HTH domain antitoxin
VSLVIEFPDEFVRAVRFPENELANEARKELALAFFARGALSLGKAAELSGLRRSDFERILSERRVECPWTSAEIDRDLEWGEQCL